MKKYKKPKRGQTKTMRVHCDFEAELKKLSEVEGIPMTQLTEDLAPKVKKVYGSEVTIKVVGDAEGALKKALDNIKLFR